MNTELLAPFFIIAIPILVIIKTFFLSRANDRAYKYVRTILEYSKRNKLIDEYFIYSSFYEKLFNPFKWTYKQYYKGLEDD